MPSTGTSALEEDRNLRELPAACWPAALRELPRPPERLWVRGSLPAEPAGVAVVGTRAATEEALDLAEQLGRDLAASGLVVYSGGALGIDGAAHRGALSAGGTTVAVLAGGLDRPYPPEHAELFERIVAGGGALLAEVPPGERPRPGRFLARNRLLAALAQAVVVVQAPARSGALSTARKARDYGRPLFVVPFSPLEPRAEGGLALLARGEARVCLSARDVLTVAVPPPAARARGEAHPMDALTLQPMDAPESLADAARALLEAFGPAGRTLDEAARRLDWPVQRLRRELLPLLMAGRLQALPGGRYRVRRAQRAR